MFESVTELLTELVLTVVGYTRETLDSYLTFVKRATLRLSLVGLAGTVLAGAGTAAKSEALLAAGLLVIGLAILLWASAAFLLLVTAREATKHLDSVRSIVRLMGIFALTVLLLAMYITRLPILERPHLLLPLGLAAFILGMSIAKSTMRFDPKLAALAAALTVGFVTASLVIPSEYFAGTRRRIRFAAVRYEERTIADTTVRPAPILYNNVTVQTLEFFDTATQRPRVWYHTGADGTYELFNHAGYHYRTGDELLSVTKEVIDDIIAHAPAPPVLTDTSTESRQPTVLAAGSPLNIELMQVISEPCDPCVFIGRIATPIPVGERTVLDERITVRGLANIRADETVELSLTHLELDVARPVPLATNHITVPLDGSMTGGGRRLTFWLNRDAEIPATQVDRPSANEILASVHRTTK